MGLTLFHSIQSNSVYAASKPWTFLIFVNGNNNLDQNALLNLKAMEQVGSSDQVNVVAQWASISTGQTVRMLIEKSKNPNAITSPILQNLGKVDMGDYHALEDFIAWGVAQYPAEHYFIEVWNHGSGWNAKSTLSTYDISYDETTGHHISTQELGWVMDGAAKKIKHKVDIFASDACLMAMVEVATELSDSVHLYGGSEETEPAMGWDYKNLLEKWNAKPYRTPEEVAILVAETYVKSYEGSINEVTYSIVDLNE